MSGSGWPIGGYAKRFARWSAIAIALGAAAAPAVLRQDDAFLEDLSKRSFQFFWEQADPATGHRPRSIADHGSASSENHVKVGSIASVGFGLTGLCIAAERGWQPRDAHRARTRTTLQTFAARSRARLVLSLAEHPHRRARVDQRGVVDRHGAPARRRPVGASVLPGRSRDRAPRRGDLSPRRFPVDAERPSAVLSHGWRPESGMIVHRWDAYSEAMLLYVLGLGSPTFPLPAASWRAWVRPELTWDGTTATSRTPDRCSSISTRTRGSIFAAGAIPSRRTTGSPTAPVATRANRGYCLNLRDGSPATASVWGITASDARGGYRAWGGPPRGSAGRRHGGSVRRGRIADAGTRPGAAGAAADEAPLRRSALRALRLCRRVPSDRGWINPDVIGIDVGITLLSAENLRSGNVWRWFMANPEIVAAMKRAGFVAPGRRAERRARAAHARGTRLPLIASPDPAARGPGARALDAIPARWPIASRRSTFDAPNGVRCRTGCCPRRHRHPRHARAARPRSFMAPARLAPTTAPVDTAGAGLGARRDARAVRGAFVLAPQMPARSADYRAGDRRRSRTSPGAATRRRRSR